MKALLVLVLLMWTAPFGAARACELALAFALDVSGSVNESEHQLQRDGVAAALLDPDVVTAISAQPGGVALMVYEWSDSRQQTQISAWRLVRGLNELKAIAAEVLAAPRSATGGTGIGPAVAFGALMFDYGPDCRRRVIDVSGDGKHNNGYRPHVAREMQVMQGVTVNALVIEGAEPEVLAYYVDHVISGQGAFVEIAAGYEDYAAALRRKLLREIPMAVADR
ncbi:MULTISPECIES: DUF1194 domain-containing protein [unclassified Ruegeria]|uniref:DUF1194 domain-containing protein n=1 Tax=unclassified Ruegeria TaxID=2625375 RepID=UPI001489F715|nr:MULTISPECIES: DUF1194 domain-containing protein [unclassified Ruegeria]